MGDDGVNFDFFIQSTIQKNIPWKSLASLLIHLAPTPEKSKQVIEILVHELELWVAKVDSHQIKTTKIQANNDQNQDDNNKLSDEFDYEGESIVSDAERITDHEIAEK